ncbi:homocysteine S-methyltransferase family protein [Vibrio palustris]|uniref:Homocysteine S-methyltransferase n=1 Tax=Vibrio palustris TaxID=1918946 RepID=A0A1R4B5C1_9VIBR|nr:homocysteine S-methyltransferase family protein [Vibrio palustris]SJL84115.1 Homocysteine S-methyltransferase [Vibrio palustris]
MSKNNISILDGGMSRELEKLGAPFRQPEWSALALIETPDLVRDAHQAFINAGSQVVTTNSYALVPFHIGEQRFKEEAQQLAARSGEMARQAVNHTNNQALVAGSLPPLFGSYRADLFQAEHVETIATPLIEGLAPYIDVWLNETQSLIAEPKAINSLLKKLGYSDKPLWVAFTLEDEAETDIPRLRSGESVEEAVIAMANEGVSAILFNCCQPEVISAAIRISKETLHRLGQSDIQLGAYANAFGPQSKDAAANEELDVVRDDLTPPAYVNWTQQWADDGATLLGGCCGIGVEHIAKLKQHFDK